MANVKEELLETITWKQRAVGWVKRNLVYVAVFLLSIVYILGGLLKIIETGKSIENIILDGSLALVVGWVITALFGLGGSVSGQADPSFIKTKQGYGEIIAKNITPHIEKLDFFCEDETKEALRRKQSHILLKGALSYTSFIKGEYDNDTTLTETQKKLVKQARDTQIKPLTSTILLSEIDEAEDETSFGRTPKQYKRSRFVKTMASKIIVTLIFGYYSMTFREQFDIGAMLWATIQIAVFITFGTLEWLNAYNYEINEHRQAIIKKTNFLLVFYNKITTNPKLYDDRLKELKNSINIESEVEVENERKETESRELEHQQS